LLRQVLSTPNVYFNKHRFLSTPNVYFNKHRFLFTQSVDKTRCKQTNICFLYTKYTEKPILTLLRFGTTVQTSSDNRMLRLVLFKQTIMGKYNHKYGLFNLNQLF
jgi:hypothetical protein